MTNTPAEETIPCEVPGCNARAKPGMGMKGHMTRAHKNGHADPDEVFTKVAQATKILWPDPEDVYLNFEVIAEWRKATIKVLTR